MKVDRYEWINQYSEVYDTLRILTKGCNLACTFCEQRMKSQLSEDFLAMEDIVWEAIQNKDKIRTVIFSGGEPTLQEDLIFWAETLKAEGFEIRLETNGTRPDQLEALIASRLIDYVSLDVKSCPSGYESITSSRDSFEGLTDQVDWSMNLLSMSGIPYELRTTVLANHHNVSRLKSMAKWVGNEAPWVLQQFRRGDLTGSTNTLQAYTADEMRQLKHELKNEFGLNEVQLKCDE